MGLIRMGPPADLIVLLREHFDLKTFIETGTFLGKTAVWASNHFEKVSTIELSKKLYEETAGQYGNIQNIDFLFGDSRSLLAHIIPRIKNSAIFWLDGLWCGGDSYGDKDQCPLLAEIYEINKSSFNRPVLSS